MYGQKSTTDLLAYAAEANASIVDLRSDTISKPSNSMRKAMFEAEVGDDVYGEDPTVNKLQEKAAKLVGKEAALFVSSGTMGNLISVMSHCRVRGCEIYCGEDSHIVHHEQGGAAQIAGVTVCPIPNDPDGTFNLNQLERKIRSDNIHEPISTLITVENTINGKVVPQNWIDRLSELAKKHKLKLHLDGARLFNASVALNVPVDQIAKNFDSLTFCLSKGLGAPVGSVVCGTKSFIDYARRVRKVIGGGLRQSGILAAAGIVALDEVVSVLKYDHKRAYKLALAIKEMKSETFSVNLQSTQTNMVQVTVLSNIITASDFINRLQSVEDNIEEDKCIVRGLALSKTLARFVTYYEITDEMIDAAIKKITYVIRKLDLLHQSL